MLVLFVCLGSVGPALCPGTVVNTPSAIKVLLCFAPGVFLVSLKGFPEVL